MWSLKRDYTLFEFAANFFKPGVITRAWKIRVAFFPKEDAHVSDYKVKNCKLKRLFTWTGLAASGNKKTLIQLTRWLTLEFFPLQRARFRCKLRWKVTFLRFSSAMLFSQRGFAVRVHVFQGTLKMTIAIRHLVSKRFCFIFCLQQVHIMASWLWNRKWQLRISTQSE